ncbi:MAG: sulfotransferase family 2 domain-containing protein [Elainellaceae cyanobacterium]
MATSSESSYADQHDVDQRVEPADAKTLIFLHIPKAAGTTMASILRAHYGSEASYRTRMHAFAHLQTLPEAERRRLRLIHGHMPFGLHKHLPQPAVYVTLLRHPVERVISHYYFVLKSPSHPGYPVAQAARSIAEYVGCGLQKQTNNVQTRHISGVGGTAGFDDCTPQHLQQAKRNLDRAFVVAGTSEQFDATLLLLGQRLGWSPSPYPRLNVNPQRPKRELISPRAIAIIERYNALDLALYHYVNQRLKQQIAAQGSPFQAQLQAFQQENVRYGELRRAEEPKQSNLKPPQVTQSPELNAPPPEPAPPELVPSELAQLKAQLRNAQRRIEALETLQQSTQKQLRKAMFILTNLRSSRLLQLGRRLNRLRRGLS